MAQRLALIREQSGLNQADFAARLGFPKRTYLSWERMEREPPAALLKAILDVFDIDPAWVLAGPEALPRRSGDQSATRQLRLQRVIRGFADDLGVVLPMDEIENLASSALSLPVDHEDSVLAAIRDSFHAQLGRGR